jgi:rhodanese-related sulfurtransferase
MVADAATPIAELEPRDAWKLLSEQGEAVLIDVRSAPEWGFVGGPDLSAIGREVLRIEWQVWPGMARNPDFVSDVSDALGVGEGPVLFLCRSGARSLAAATALTKAFAERGTARRCINVAEGFEGDLDADGHRGAKNGWKAKGLPWVQT